MLFWHILAVCRWYFSFHSRFLSMSIVIICMWDVQFTHFSYKDWKCMTQGRQIHLGPRGELLFWRNIFFSLESWPCSNSFQKVFDWFNVVVFVCVWIINKGQFIYHVSTFSWFLDPSPLRKHVFITENKQKFAFYDS